MTLSSTTSRMPTYTGNGSTDTYSYTFKINTAADLYVVTRVISTGVETVLTYPTDYTVTGAGDAAGGTIVLAAGNLASTKKLIIRRKPALTQSTDIRNGGAFYPSVHESRFDTLTMQIQSLQDELNRCLKLPETILASEFDPEMPAGIAGTEGKVFLTNDTGDGMAAVADWPSASDITNASSYAAQAAASAADADASADAADTSADDSASSAAAAAASAALAATYLPTVGGTRAAPTAIVAVSGITATAGIDHTIFIQGSGGAVDVSANPQISAGTTVGQKLRLIARDDTNTVMLEDGTGLSLNGTWIGSADSVLELFWDGTNWVEIGRNA
jgi:hypothetical protein